MSLFIRRSDADARHPGHLVTYRRLDGPRVGTFCFERDVCGIYGASDDNLHDDDATCLGTATR